MKECDTLEGVTTYSDPSYMFSGGQDPQPTLTYAPAHHPGSDAYHAYGSSSSTMWEEGAAYVWW